MRKAEKAQGLTRNNGNRHLTRETQNYKCARATKTET